MRLYSVRITGQEEPLLVEAEGMTFMTTDSTYIFYVTEGDSNIPIAVFRKCDFMFATSEMVVAKKTK